MSQMLFINSQWTSPGFSFIQPGCLALRLSIHPHDLCLGTTTAIVNFSASARDILYSPQDELSKFTEQEDKLFTPRNHPDSPDLISKYAKKHNEMSKSMAQTARYFTPFEEQLRVFTRQQDELQRELYQEKEFLKKAGHYHVPDLLDDFDIIKGKEDDSKQQVDEALAKQLNLLNERLDRVVKSLEDRQKSMYIREEDEESEISEIPLQYDEAPVTDERPIIEKLNFSMLSNRTPVPADEYQTSLDLKTPTPISENSGKSLSTAQSFENPLFAEKNPKIPIEWMKLLPLEAGSARYADNLLTYNKSKEDRNVDISTPKQEHFYKTPSYLSFNGHKSVTERGVGTQNSARIGETQTAKNDDVANRKTVDLKAVRRMSQEDMKDILDRVVKY